MARTTSAEVIALMGTSLDATTVDVFIDTANRMVTAAIGSSTLLDDATKTDIEKWLTAHLIASTRDRLSTSEKVGDAAVSYNALTEKGLSSTPYGAQVLALDSAGLMQTLSNKKANLWAVVGPGSTTS